MAAPRFPVATPTRQRMAIVCALVALFAGLQAAAAWGQALPSLDYRGGAQGRVAFDHGLHAARGFVCADCHTRWPATGTQLFQTHRLGLTSLADHNRPGQCFACHDGKLAFDDCAQCHRSPG